jgi:hypothetical protein
LGVGQVGRRAEAQDVAAAVAAHAAGGEGPLEMVRPG